MSGSWSNAGKNGTSFTTPGISQDHRWTWDTRMDPSQMYRPSGLLGTRVCPLSLSQSPLCKQGAQALSILPASSQHPRNQLSASLQPALDGGWAELHTVDFSSRAVTGGCVPVGNVSPSIQWGRRHAGLALSSETPMRPGVPPTRDPVHLLEDREEGKERSQYCPGLSSQCGGPLPSPVSLSVAQSRTG